MDHYVHSLTDLFVKFLFENIDVRSIRCIKSIETEVIFILIEISDIHFRRNSHVGNGHIYSNKVFIRRSTFENSFLI